VSRAREVAIRRSISSPSAVTMHSWLSPFMEIESYRIHGGWPASWICGNERFLTRLRLWGETLPPRTRGGQPLQSN
jgi:hypothetical protein